MNPIRINHSTISWRVFSLLLITALLAAPSQAPEVPEEVSAQLDILGPPGSGKFGRDVIAIPNGNIVVTDPYYDDGGTVDAGAVYLYDGATASLISTSYGSHTNDRLGNFGIQILANGHYVVLSPSWDAGRGAATWCSATAGCSGVVSAANSVVGSTPNDGIGVTVKVLASGAFVVNSEIWDYPALAVDAGAVRWCSGTGPCIGPLSEANSLVGDQTNDHVGVGIIVLSNGHYVVRSPDWHDQRGAATWCSGITGRTGKVAASNSLYGSTVGDQAGYNAMEVANSRYLVISPFWDNGLTTNVGAVTRCSGTGTCAGSINSVNSLVGDHANDRVGLHGATVLPSGNYVVQSGYWNGFLGAATWCSGTLPCNGAVTAGNSLVGSVASDDVGGIINVLANGHYVVKSSSWNSARGAVTWCEDAPGCTGTVSSSNSLVGSAANETVGFYVQALTNNHYVVGSPYWNGFKGAATWCDGEIGCTGMVDSTNSLVGGIAEDRVGETGIVSLTNGNYVVQSSDWSGDVGAATWCDGLVGYVGTVSPANSLVGTTPGDRISRGVVSLLNGNYVVHGAYWDNGSMVDAGAATWCDGATGCVGPVSAANSLVGNKTGDYLGYQVLGLTNGHYVVKSTGWDFSTATDAGAVTWCNGMTGCTGIPSDYNSLIGSRVEDWIGSGGIVPLSNGQYVVLSPYFDRGIYTNAGAVTLGMGWGGTTGFILANNSIRGTVAEGGDELNWDFDYLHNQLVVGRPADNTVSLWRMYSVFLPILVR
ncbi:MAG: hypothetical protein A2Z16_05560 [Chloroflexi bacterium RBG_16_54_18]|nr:MAG: hypothetical protein A2Z16_05560 [Chloroflexi bacterium RBG_16_54_18]